MVSYTKSDNLTDRQRAIVTNIVIRSELTETNDQKIKRERFLELQKYICRIFPTEEKDTWYTPYRVVNKTGIAARGRLVDCYYNMRQDLLASGTIQSLRKRKSDTFTGNATSFPSCSFYVILKFLSMLWVQRNEFLIRPVLVLA